MTANKPSSRLRQIQAPQQFGSSHFPYGKFIEAAAEAIVPRAISPTLGPRTPREPTNAGSFHRLLEDPLAHVPVANREELELLCQVVAWLKPPEFLVPYYLVVLYGEKLLGPDTENLSNRELCPNKDIASTNCAKIHHCVRRLVDRSDFVKGCSRSFKEQLHELFIFHVVFKIFNH